MGGPNISHFNHSLEAMVEVGALFAKTGILSDLCFKVSHAILIEGTDAENVVAFKAGWSQEGRACALSVGFRDTFFLQRTDHFL